MKHLDNFLKHKVKQNYKEHGIPYYLQDCINQTTNGNTEALSFPKKDRKNKTCHYCGKLGHVEKTCWKEMKDLEENVNDLEDIAPNGQLINQLGETLTLC